MLDARAVNSSMVTTIYFLKYIDLTFGDFQSKVSLWKKTI